MSLREYQRKRDFTRTAEPAARKTKPKRKLPLFVIQKHDASRLHYDFRLEVDGTLKSWAVPKGIPFARGDKRLAVHVEDHPLDYASFEGVIPAGQYGGGTVMVWDTGTWENLGGDAARDLKAGKLHFALHGKKLEGEWTLVRTRGGEQGKENWLLIKSGGDVRPLSKKRDDESVLTKRSMARIARDRDKEWQSNRESTDKESFRARIRNRLLLPSRAPPKPVGTIASKSVDNPRRRPVEASSRGASNDEPRRRVRGGTNGRGGGGGKGRPDHGRGGLKPRFVAPMKAKLTSEPPPGGDWIYELKFDGFRAIAIKDGNRVELLSRNAKDLTHKFPEIAEAVAALALGRAVLDGEIVALDPEGRSSFQLLQAYELGEERPPICYYVFDLLHLEGRDLRNQSLVERKSQLESLLRGAPDSIRFSASIDGDPRQLLEKVKTRGLEGIIGKLRGSTYESGRRSGAWIKLKCVNEQEFVIGGFTPPQGARKYFGALLVGYFENEKLKFAGKVGTGFNTALLRVLHTRFQKLRRAKCPFADLPEKSGGRWAQSLTPAEMKRCSWVEPEIVCEVKFTEWTRDGKLRHPVFIGIREDKEARSVIHERPSTIARAA
jgi:bifunctional non-homologous end joining protein LigD